MSELSKSQVFISSFAEQNQTTGSSVLEKNRNVALEALQNLDFPTTRTESWKYTRLGRLTKNSFVNTNANQVDLAEYNLPEIEGNQLVFVNGNFNEELSTVEANDQFVISTLLEAKENYTDVFEKHYGSLSNTTEEIFSAINTSYLSDGVFIQVKNNVVLDKPVHVVHIINNEHVVSQPRNLFVVGRSAEAKVVFSYLNKATSISFTNSVTEVILNENSKLEINRVQNEETDSFHISNIEVIQKADSIYLENTVSLSGDIVRNNTNVLSSGSNTNAFVNGVVLAKDKQVVDNHVFVDHSAPNCESNQVFKYILDDESRGVFNGKVMVRKDAQKINAYQTNSNILLSDHAIIDAKPELEIYADDVKCSHGTTTGQLDEDAIYYLRARGVGEEQARNMLVFAFAEEALENISIESFRTYLDKLFEDRFNFQVLDELDWEA